MTLICLVLLLQAAPGLTSRAYAYYGDEGYEDAAAVYGPAYIAYDSTTELGPVLGPALPEAEPEPAATPQPLKYQVASGDTLYKIARDFNISITALLVENDIPDPKRLSVGQQLLIPDSEAIIPLPGGERQVVKQVISSTLTAYTAGVESTGKSPSHSAYGITYSGSRAEEGRTIAVDPNVIPIGTTVFIDGIGIRKAEDTGSAVRGARIDVFMDDVKQAINFGVKRNVKVYVLSGENV
ncbi:murein transglycosylase [Paenibacillus rigui]|uniref:Murein transglycosylase n=2 Tax=Paenibacillus rigui TaxID=554312 RepID=A0A229UJP7_9BACL|nr:murein transglycosylase [Paenibacillus rigui]